MTDVFQEPRQSRTDHTTTGGGSYFSTGAGDSGYGSVLHTPVAGPSFSHAVEPEFAPSADVHAVQGRHLMPSLADYLPANPYLSPYPAPAPPPPQPAYGNSVGSDNSDLDRLLFDPALIDPALLPTPPLYDHDQFAQFAPPAFDTPPHHPDPAPLFPLYQWVQPDTPTSNPWITPADLPSPVQEQFTYPDPDVATDSYVANWVGAALNLPLGPERGGVFAVPAPPPVEAPAAGPKKRVRKSRAKGKGVAAGATVSAPVPPTPVAAPPLAAMQMEVMMAPAPEPVVFGPSPAQTLAALQSAASSSPGVPVPEAYRHVWFLNGRGRVSKTRDNNPRCQRCRRRHWAVSFPSFLDFPFPIPSEVGFWD